MLLRFDSKNIVKFKGILFDFLKWNLIESQKWSVRYTYWWSNKLHRIIIRIIIHQYYPVSSPNAREEKLPTCRHFSFFSLKKSRKLKKRSRLMQILQDAFPLFPRWHENNNSTFFIFRFSKDIDSWWSIEVFYSILIYIIS